MPYIAHAFIWLAIYVVLPHHNQFIELNRMPRIAHVTKFEPCFMYPSSQTFCIFLDGFYTTISDYWITHSFVEGSLIVVSR